MKGKFTLIAAVATVAMGGGIARDLNSSVKELGQIAVTATIGEVNDLKYAGSIGMLNSDDLKSQTNVIDAIKNIPGIDGGMEMGRQIGKQFQIRGFGYQSEERVIIKQDGVQRTPGIYSDMISSFRSDGDILKRVEVVKGTSSILHGSGAIGGVVTMQTKEASDYLSAGKDFGAMIGGRYESNNMHAAKAAIYGDFDYVDFLIYGKKAKHKKVKLADGGSHYKNKNYDDLSSLANDEKITTNFAKFGTRFGDDHKLVFSAFKYDEKIKGMWQNLWQFSENDDDLFVRGKLTQKDYVLDYSYKPLNPWLNLAIKTYTSKAKYARGYYRKGNRVDYTNKDDRYGFGFKNTSNFTTAALDHELILGSDYGNQKENAEFIINGEPNEQTSFPNEYKNYGIYAQDTLSIENFELTLGSRYDKFKRSIKRAGITSYDGDRFSPRVAAAYTLFERLTLLGGYAQSFRAPTPHETSQSGPINRAYYYVPNPDLKAEIGKEYELGFSFADENLLLDSDALTFKFMFFNGKIKDMIAIKHRKDLGTPPLDGSLNPQRYGQYQNIDNARRRGIELGSNYKTDDFRLGASYEKLKLYDEKTRENINNHADKLIVRAGYSPTSQLDFDVKFSHWFKPKSNPDSYVSRGTRYYYVDKTFIITDFSGKFKQGRIAWFDGMEISFGVNNIFDKQYINANQTRESISVGAGRNYYVDFELKF